MNKTIYITAVIFLLACVSTPPSRSLVNTDVIKSMVINNSPGQIIDVREVANFKKGHIPGAVNISRSDLEDNSGGFQGMRIKKNDFEELMKKLGLNDKDSIYLYDSKANTDASRLWWLFKYYGFEKVALIDGGFIRWRTIGYKEESGESIPVKRSEFLLSAENNTAILAEKEDILNGVYEQVIDCRSIEEYSGDVIKNGAVRPGHIPNAIHCDYYNLLQESIYTLKSEEELRLLMQEKGISLDKKTVVYCHSGVRSAMMSFVLTEILGMTDVANYDGSWIEWSSDETLSIE